MFTILYDSKTNYLKYSVDHKAITCVSYPSWVNCLCPTCAVATYHVHVRD